MKVRTAGVWALAAITLLGSVLVLVKVLAASENAPPVIPIPKEFRHAPSQFTLGPQTRILTDAGSRATGEFLAERLGRSTGFNLKVEVGGTEPQPVKGAIGLSAQTGSAAPEGYELSVTSDSVMVRASAAAGVFYGVQTLLQVCPPEIFSTNVVSRKEWPIPCLQIQDAPRFPWRGLLLDSARHFFTKGEVETVLDLIAMQKLNRFQWHLTDDQGWRLEIKKHPELTKVGAWRKSIGFGLPANASTAYGPDGRYGGFYTQADIREIVTFAAARNITIVPEIEMPGHAGAALSAYPELSCQGGPYNTDLEGNVPPGVYCPGNEKTFQLLEDVLTEVMDIFPGKYIHIGGDEVAKDSWRKCPKCQALMKREGLKNEQELQSYFIRRIEKFVSSKGHTLVGWSEIREGGLASNAVLMDWIGGALESAREGHDVIMTPTAFCYLDYYQSTNRAAEPLAIGGFLPLDKVYSFEPSPAGLEAQFRGHILGAQGNLWTEFIPSLSHAEYMMYPRLAALAEAAWSPAEKRDYTDFLRRLQVQIQRWNSLGANYRKTASVSP